MKEPKVSVIIGSYNCEKFICETVQSVIEQTFRDWELIIVDDCSTDGTCQKISQINDDRIRLIRLDSNSRLPAVPRNIGMRSSRGDYIAFLDHDDLWLPQKLEKQVNFLEKNRDFFLAYGKCIVQKDGRQLDVSPKKANSGNIFKDLYLHFNIIGLPTVIMRNEVKKYNYFFDQDKKFATVEDYALWMLIAKDQKIAFLNEPLAIYRVHSGSLSGGAFSHFKKCRYVLKKFASVAPKTMYLRAQFNFCINLLYVGILVVMMRIKRAIITFVIKKA